MVPYVVSALKRTDDLGQAEIEELRAGFGEHDVRGLEIAMHNPLAMGFVEGVGNLDAVTQCLVEGDPGGSASAFAKAMADRARDPPYF